MSTPPVEPRSTSAWQAARDAVARAGERLSTARADDSEALAEVATHLRLAWGHLSIELTGASDDAAAVAALAERIRMPTRAGEGLARRLVFATANGEEAAALLRTPGLREGLELELDAVRRATEECAARRDGSARTGLGLVAAVAILLAIAPVFRDVGGTVEAPWRGLYYDNAHFEGTPVERLDLTLGFDFGERAPIRGVRRDGFSVRWDTCLTLDAPATVRFELASDDGSRLFIDDAQVIDNWGEHNTETRDATVTLGAGSHYLIVEYYDALHGADVALEASFGSEEADVLPVELLTAPRDGQEPCR